MDYLTATELFEKWKISFRRIGILCSEGRVEGEENKGKMWLIPFNAKNQWTQDIKLTRRLCMSNFTFLEKYWKELSKIGDFSEKYVYSDPNTSIIKQGMLAEVMVKYILRKSRNEAA